MVMMIPVSMSPDIENYQDDKLIYAGWNRVRFNSHVYSVIRTDKIFFRGDSNDR